MILTEPLTCTHRAIIQDVPFQVWEGVTSSGVYDLPVLLVRLIHNKPRYYFANYFQCYTHYFSPKFYFQSLDFLGLFLFLGMLLGIHVLIKKKHFKLLLFLIILYPTIMVFELYRYLL